ncbi:metallopeptidase [Caproiciproducens sp. NJN-50]|uniref:vWA domain-containing protein n=1 Tax=Acutalibacteraceae TaxID=3082771 RepID=UPI000FFE1E6E|nr:MULTISPECIES: VWA-like domain-containing protein [Acutalibacteraceae]QAT50896.1 metallopeptidase [Caproiciproducens sp. NJN-50]
MADEMEERVREIGDRILKESRTDLYLSMRFLDLALSALSYEMRPGAEYLGTDGASLFYDPDLLFVRYRQNRILINRGYLHCVLHCVFRHLWKRPGEDRELWDLACDIAMESVLDGIAQRSVRQSPSWFRRNFYETLREKCKVPTAEKVYELLRTMDLNLEARMELEREFRIDDHSFWPDPQKRPPAGMPPLQQKWDDISRKMQTGMETLSKDPAEHAQAILSQVRVENRERYDYRRFLRKFAVLREEARLDPDSFDPIFYSYGLRLYGNLPLIEPQETRETRRIEDFVIAVDTSMSCSGRLVRGFLEQTYSILKDTESFFRRVNIHIVQCDETVRSDRKITNGEELRDYMDHFELIGSGGTDFRPVFRYVDELLRGKEFRRLKGLIYFTDGRGVYPEHRPPYDVAFVFLRDDFTDADVPPWAMKLILEPDDLDRKPETAENQEDWEDLPHYEY